MYIYIYMYNIYICIYIYVCIYIYCIYIYVCIYIYICLTFFNIYIYRYIYIYICIHTVQVSFFPVQFPSWLSHVQLDCWRFEVGSDHKALPDGDKNTVKNTMVVPNRVNKRIGGEEFCSVIDLILNHTFCSQYVVSIMKHLHIRLDARRPLKQTRPVRRKARRKLVVHPTWVSSSQFWDK